MDTSASLRSPIWRGKLMKKLALEDDEENSGQSKCTRYKLPETYHDEK